MHNPAHANSEPECVQDPNNSWLMRCPDQGLASEWASNKKASLDPALSAVCSEIWGANLAPFTGYFRINGPILIANRSGYSVDVVCSSTSGVNFPNYELPASRHPHSANYDNSCATRPAKDFLFEGWDPAFACYKGCKYDTSSKACDYIGDAGIYTCAISSAPPDGGLWSCDGPTPIGTPVAPRPPDPDDPDPDDPDPDDPGPDDPDPDDPDPEEPDPSDDQDDGQQVSETLGPKLDAIEQAVLGLGPKVDAVKAAVDAGTAAANANASAIVGAINAQGNGTGGGGGDGSGSVDLTPLTPGDDGGDHPALGEIVEEGSVSDLLGQLDQDGFGLSRSCPAYQWQLSFDLGWTEFNMGPAADFICTALQVFAYMIALAGMIQAAYILGRVGAS